MFFNGGTIIFIGANIRPGMILMGIPIVKKVVFFLLNFQISEFYMDNPKQKMVLANIPN